MDVAATAEHDVVPTTVEEQKSRGPQRASLDSNGGDQKEENKFQKAIAAWRNIDLTTLIPKLDTAASDLVAHQRDSLVQRKDLAQKTKDFRKLDDAGKLNDIKALLKAYQTYIDLITNQSKAIHSAFLQVYTPLSEAPDPYPLLEASIDALITASDTVPRMTEENQRLQKQVSNLTSQLERTEEELSRERNARQELESSRDEKIKSVEQSWEAVLEEKKDNWAAKERSLEEKVEGLERVIKEVKASYEVAQRLNKGEDADADGIARSGATAAELEIVSSELDRANLRIAEVEARNEQLRLELAQSASSSGTSKAVEDDPAYLRLQSENSSLIRRLENWRFEKESERRKWEGELRNLEREVSALKKERENLREKMRSWSDYENLKRELEVLKSIEFATGDDDETEAAEALHESNGSASKGESLEQLLLARNKKLNNELTILRVSHQDLQSRLSKLQEDLSTTTAELEKSQRLNQTLEADLEKVQEEASHAFPSSAMSVAGTYTSRYPSSAHPGRRGRNISPTSSIISGFDPQHVPSGTPVEVLRSGEPVGGGSGMLPMITAQRDRYKKKNGELEAELQKQYQIVQSLRSEVASLQRDNLNLYEKTRYVSTYARGGTAGGSGSSYSAAAPRETAISIGGADASESRYKAAYESNLSPFAAFRGRESARAFKRMSMPERAVFQVTRLVLATRTSRNLFAAYCLGLHLMVLIMLYQMGGDTSGAAMVVAHAPIGAGKEDVDT
ncbi:uncharacterized protein PV09_04135 [Verruconis gallopava]|uniref:Protein CASP n=1 Tax=Verruconis gallopava TaxID=253628 RepID=A0A0D2ADF0_9PEZI|nr:uncharacterized protein PV09_04135 [Verruconis gallopava]KIW04973.1 hypothetical protein PV09_04135 [Verruconis gallopava]